MKYNEGVYAMIEKDSFQKNMIFDFTQTDEPMFEEIKNYIDKLGLSVSLVYLMPRSVSRFAVRHGIGGGISKVPVLTLYTSSCKAYNQYIGNSEKMSLINESYRDKIVSKWKKICLNYRTELHEYYDHDMYVRLINAQVTVTDHVIRNIKEQTYDIIAEYSNVTPMYIFASSEPCYNIIFKNAKEYTEAESSFDNITSAVKEIVAQKSYVILGKPAEDVLKINYMHHEDPDLNFFGLSRED